jgi:aminopeptidase N
VDQLYESKRLLIRSIVSQWFGHFVSPKNWVDIWLIVGLANYLTGFGVSKIFGENEYKYRLKRDMIRACQLDTTQPPLYPGDVKEWMKFVDASEFTDFVLSRHPLTVDPLLVQHFHPDDEWGSVRSEFLMVKSPLIFHMLNKRLGKGNLQKTMNKIMFSAISGDLNGLSTTHFFKVARKVSGRSDMKIFADQWVYGSGCPKFEFAYHFNRKKMVVEVKFRQSTTSHGYERVTPLFVVGLICCFGIF